MKSILTCVVIFCSLVKPVAEKWKVDPALILAVMWVESRCQAKAKSKGNYGLMQVNEIWVKESRKRGERLRLRDLLELEKNVDVGTMILGECLTKAKGNLRRALVCYRGEKDWEYVRKVERAYFELKRKGVCLDSKVEKILWKNE